MNQPFYKLNVVAAAFLLIGLSANAQTNSVSIGTQSTNASAVLWLNSPNGNQGLIIPVGSRTSVTTPAKGMLIFDTNQVYVHDGTNWNTLGGSGSGSSYSLSYNATTKVITLNPTAGTGTIDISTTTLSGGDLGGTLATPTVTGLLGKQLPIGTLPSTLQYLVYDGTTSTWKFQTPASATLGNLTSTTTGITITGGTGAVSGTGTTVNIQNATTSQPGLLTAVDWNTFNNKVSLGGDLGGTTASPTISKLAGQAYTFPVSNTVAGVLTNSGAGILTWAPVSGFLSTTLSSGKIIVGSNTNVATPVAMSGDAAIDNTGKVTIANNAISGGTGGKITDATITDADISAAAGIVDSKLATISTAGKVSGNAITSGTIGGSTIINTSGDILSSGTGSLSIAGTTTFGGHKYTWPTVALAASTTYLSTDGSGNLSWANVPIVAPVEVSSNSNAFEYTGNTTIHLAINNTLGQYELGQLNNATSPVFTSNWNTGDANISGALGIGLSTAAQRKLALFDGGSNNNNQFIGFGVDPTGTLRYQVSVNVNDHVFYAGTSATTSNELMRITGTGNVGIGTPSPGSKLQVQNGTNAPGGGNGNIEVHTANGNGSAIYADFSTGGDGTGTVYSRGTVSGYDANATGTNNTGVWGHQFGNGSGGWGVLASNGSSLTSPTTYAGLGGVSYPGIFMGGNVGIGTNGPSEVLHAYGTTGTSILVEDSPGAAGGATASLKLKAYGNVLFGGPVTNNYQISGNTILPFLSFSLNGSNLATMSTAYLIPGADNTMSIGGSSNRWTSVYAVNGTIQTSDIRLKSNIKPLNYGLSEVMKFNPVTYSWKNKKDSKKIGLIAQEVQKLVPEVVTEGEYLGMNYAELVPVLIKAVQEQQKLIDDQKNQIDELKAQQNQKETSSQSELNQLKAEVANIKKALGMEASTKKK